MLIGMFLLKSEKATTCPEPIPIFSKGCFTPDESVMAHFMLFPLPLKPKLIDLLSLKFKVRKGFVLALSLSTPYRPKQSEFFVEMFKCEDVSNSTTYWLSAIEISGTFACVAVLVNSSGKKSGCTIHILSFWETYLIFSKSVSQKRPCLSLPTSAVHPLMPA